MKHQGRLNDTDCNAGPKRRVHGPDHIKENTYTPNYTQVVWRPGAKHIHIRTWCHHHGDLRPAVIILVCSQLASFQHHALSQCLVWLLYPQGFGLVQFHSCTLYRGSCEKGKSLVITVASAFCCNWNRTKLHAIDTRPVWMWGLGVQLRCWQMSLCTFMLYLCFCPGEVTLQHAGKLVCVNCYRVGPFHSVRHYLLSYSVNCCLPLTGGETKLSAWRRCTVHKGCLSTGSPDPVHRTIVCCGYIDCLDKQWVAGSLMMMSIIATVLQTVVWSCMHVLYFRNHCPQFAIHPQWSPNGTIMQLYVCM